MKSDFLQNNFTNGEVSPNCLGRFDLAKYLNSAKVVENFMIKQLGGVSYRPGTRFVYETKHSAVRSRLLKFQYSTTQSYIIEAGNLFFRFYTDGGILLDPIDPVEVTTVYPTSKLNQIKYAQNADTMYIATGDYPVYKLQRTSATTFTMTAVDFVRGPFLDTNITSTTITPSSATGSTTLTASTSIFQSNHVGSLWRVKDAVVKITGYTNGTQVSGTVQAEPDGTAGNIGATTAQTDWAEGAWSEVRGYPKCVTFHEGRLWFANTDYEVDGLWGSVSFEYENFDEGPDDDNAININLNADTVVATRWLSSSAKGLQAGTTGGVFNISGGSGNQPITPSNVSAPRQNIYGSADIQAKRMFNYAYYVQNDKRRFLESGYFFDIDQTDAVDTTMLADHILTVLPVEDNRFLKGSNQLGGAYDFDAQQSPNNRIWIVRDDGQIAVLTRNVRQEVNGWFRVIAGRTESCDGVSGIGQFESISILSREGYPDQVWVICNRSILGETKRFVEYFTEEDFKYEWDPVLLDCSLTYDNPIPIVGVNVYSDPMVVTAINHGLQNGDQIQIDNIVGATHLNGNQYIVGDVTTNTFSITEA